MATELMIAGVSVRQRKDLLCLTDLWRASGADEGKRPAIWFRQDGAQDFSAHIADISNMRLNHIWITERGHEGATYAHWQVALAYAKYLSPQLHAEVNQVYRLYKESKSPIPFERQLETRMDNLEQRVDVIEDRQDANDQIMYEMHGNIVAVKNWTERQRLPQPRFFSEEDQRILYLVIHLEFGGRCPIDRKTRITDDEGSRLEGVTEIDHWHGPQYSKLENGLPVAKGIHLMLSQSQEFRAANQGVFEYFHHALRRLMEEGKLHRRAKFKKGNWKARKPAPRPPCPLTPKLL